MGGSAEGQPAGTREAAPGQYRTLAGNCRRRASGGSGDRIPGPLRIARPLKKSPVDARRKNGVCQEMKQDGRAACHFHRKSSDPPSRQSEVEPPSSLEIAVRRAAAKVVHRCVGSRLPTCRPWWNVRGHGQQVTPRKLDPPDHAFLIDWSRAARPQEQEVFDPVKPGSCSKSHFK